MPLWLGVQLKSTRTTLSLRFYLISDEELARDVPRLYTQQK